MIEVSSNKNWSGLLNISKFERGPPLKKVAHAWSTPNRFAWRYSDVTVECI